MAFRDRLQKKVDDAIAKKLKKRKDKVANAVLDSLVENTPVDTGKAVSNYQVSTKSPKKFEIPAHLPGKKKSTIAQNQIITKGLGAAVIKKADAFDDIYITNNADYIDELEKGKSRQGKGFVEEALSIGRSVANE